MKRNLILLVALILSLQFQTAFAKIYPAEHINKVDCDEAWNCFKCNKEDEKRKKGIEEISINQWEQIFKKQKIKDPLFDKTDFRNYTDQCYSYTYETSERNEKVLLNWQSCTFSTGTTKIDFKFPKNLDASEHCKLKTSNNENGAIKPSDETTDSPPPKRKPKQQFTVNFFEANTFDEMRTKVRFDDEEDSHLQFVKKFKDDFSDIADKKIINEYDAYILQHKKYVTHLNTLILFYDAVSKKCKTTGSNKDDFGSVIIDDKNYGPKKISKSFIDVCSTEFYSIQYIPIFKNHKIIFEEFADYVDIRDNGKNTLEEKLSNAKNNDLEETRIDKKKKDREAKRREKEKEAEAAADKLAEENRIAAEAEKKAKAAQRQRDEAKRIADEAAADKLAEEDRIAAEADKKEQARIAANKKKAAFWDTIWSLITSTLLIVIAATVGFMFGSRNNKKVSNADVVSNEQQRELVIKIKTLEEKNQSLERLIEKSLSRQEPQILTKVDIPNEVVKELSEAEKQAEVDRSRQSSYWDAIDNPNLIEKFTAAYNVIGLDKVGRVKKGENALLQVDQKSIEKSNFWAVPHKDVWVILPGRTLSINAAALTADDGRYGRELFAGIFKLEFGSQFEVTASKTLARKTAEGFLVFQQGTVMLPK